MKIVSHSSRIDFVIPINRWPEGRAGEVGTPASPRGGDPAVSRASCLGGGSTPRCTLLVASRPITLPIRRAACLQLTALFRAFFSPSKSN